MRLDRSTWHRGRAGRRTPRERLVLLAVLVLFQLAALLWPPDLSALGDPLTWRLTLAAREHDDGVVGDESPAGSPRWLPVPSDGAFPDLINERRPPDTRIPLLRPPLEPGLTLARALDQACRQFHPDGEDVVLNDRYLCDGFATRISARPPPMA